MWQSATTKILHPCSFTQGMTEGCDKEQENSPSNKTLPFWSEPFWRCLWLLSTALILCLPKATEDFPCFLFHLEWSRNIITWHTKAGNEKCEHLLSNSECSVGRPWSVEHGINSRNFSYAALCPDQSSPQEGCLHLQVEGNGVTSSLCATSWPSELTS